MPRGTRYKYEDYHKKVDGVLYKKCAYHEKIFGIDKWLPCTLEFFYKNDKNKSDGLCPECKECTLKKAYKWFEENPEKKLESDRKKIGTEKKKIIDRRAAKKQRLAGKQKAWQERNPDKIAMYGKKKRENNTHTISKNQWLKCKEYFNNQCAYCGLPVEEHYCNYAGRLRKEDLQKEHVNHFGSNDIDNCVPACKSCNDQKWEYEYNYWYNPANKNYTEDRHNKIQKWISEDHKPYIEEIKPKREYNRKKK